MFAALPQPLEVREVGGDTLLESLAGPALIAVAAIFAAFVAAYVARKNHGEQLDNDRALRDLDHARREISAAVETISEAVDALSEFANAVWSASEAHKRGRFDAERDGSDGQGVQRPPSRVGPPHSAARRHLQAAHLDRDHVGVADRHADVSNSFKDWLDTMAPQDDGSFRFDTFPGEEVPVQEPITEFVEACQRWSADRDRALKQESPPGLDPDDAPRFTSST